MPIIGRECGPAGKLFLMTPSTYRGSIEDDLKRIPLICLIPLLLFAGCEDQTPSPERIARIAEQERLRLTEEQRRRLEHLARDFPSVWSHPQVDATLKKRLLRAAILEVLVSCQETKEEDDHSPSKHRLEVTIHWKGGAHTRFHIKKRAAPRGRGVRTDPDLVGKVSQLAQSGLRDAEITRILNMQRLKTTHGLTWTQDRVCNFRKTHRIRQARPPEGENLTQSEVASTLGISRNAVCALDRRGALSKNQITDFAPWRVPRSQLDSELVQTLVRVLKETGRLPKGGCPKSQISLFPDQ